MQKPVKLASQKRNTMNYMESENIMSEKPYEISLFEAKVRTATSLLRVQEAINEVYDKVIEGNLSNEWINHALEFAKTKRIER